MLIQGIIMFRFKKYIVLTILVSLLGHLPLWAFNQQATEKLRQGIIAGNPDTVKASISEGADINTKYGADQETPLMLALREYIKAAQASAKMSNPWNVAMLATGVGLIGGSVGAVGAGIASRNPEYRNTATNIGIASVVVGSSFLLRPWLPAYLA